MMKLCFLSLVLLAIVYGQDAAPISPISPTVPAVPAVPVEATKKGDCFTVVQGNGKELTLCQKEGGSLVAYSKGDDEKAAQLTTDVDTFYIFVCGVFVFFMQAGFSMLEAGCVSERNVANILFKNTMDAGVGAIAFWLIGYGLAYGGDNAFIGTGNNFALMASVDDKDYHTWFFQWAFAATAATIVSGAVAERTKISAYFIYSFVITAFVYPVVVHWVWDGSGWLSAVGDHAMLSGDPTKSNGFIDFAGSGVVHMVGGFSGLCGAIAAKPRLGRFSEAVDPQGRPIIIQEHNQLLASLGVCILWMGWYGFNCGSTLMVSGGFSALAGKVAVTTTISAATGMITVMMYYKIATDSYTLLKTINGILAGLVSITASCATVEPWAACVIGFIGSWVYIGASSLLIKLKIDDPLDACPIHGFCGFWGVLAVGIFSTYDNISVAYSDNAPDAMSSGAQFATQLVGGVVILLWTLIASGGTFFLLSITIGVRVDKETEIKGLDTSEHGGNVYTNSTQVYNTTKEEGQVEVPLSSIAVSIPDAKDANQAVENASATAAGEATPAGEAIPAGEATPLV